jgi:hypothetical protein
MTDTIANLSDEHWLSVYRKNYKFDWFYYPVNTSQKEPVSEDRKLQLPTALQRQEKLIFAGFSKMNL